MKLARSLTLLLGTLALHAQTLRITKIDPPNWYATLPAPMLLVHGEGFLDTAFSLSDPSLHITKTVVSANGHWAQLWLAASPAQPETVTLLATHNTEKHGSEKTELPYTFAARHSAADSFTGFSSSDVMYLIMTDRFADGDPNNDGPNATDSATSAAAAAERAKPRGWHGGDLRGIQQHLDYLQQLGVTAVWPTPVYRNHDEPDSYHGYGATDLYAVDEHYGSLDDLKSLAAALHTRGMKLILDTVPNHVGPMHPWVNDEPAPNWFHGTKAHHINAESNFNALLDPHAPDRDRAATLDGWFANALPDMDTDDPTVALYLRQNAIWWIEQTGADALRIDTFPYVNRAFWHDFNGELAQLYPHLTEVGEVFNPDPVITSSFAGGITRVGPSLTNPDTRLTTPFDFPSYFALRSIFSPGPAQPGFKTENPCTNSAWKGPTSASEKTSPTLETTSPALKSSDTALKGRGFSPAVTSPQTKGALAPEGTCLAPMTKLAEVLAHDALYPHPETLVPFFGNHDTARFMNVVPGTEAEKTAALRLAFAAVLTMRGMPQIYSGDELAMHGGDDPDNRHDFPGGFPNLQHDTQPSAFTAATRTPEQAEMLSWVTTLTRIRSSQPALRCGAEQVLFADADTLVTMRDTTHATACDAPANTETRVLTALHRGPKPASLTVPLTQTWLADCRLSPPLLASPSSSAEITTNTLSLQLQPNDTLIATCH